MTGLELSVVFFNGNVSLAILAAVTLGLGTLVVADIKFVTLAILTAIALSFSTLVVAGLKLM
jgi:hypothetical protein